MKLNNKQEHIIKSIFIVLGFTILFATPFFLKQFQTSVRDDFMLFAFANLADLFIIFYFNHQRLRVTNSLKILKQREDQQNATT